MGRHLRGGEHLLFTGAFFRERAQGAGGIHVSGWGLPAGGAAALHHPLTKPAIATSAIFAFNGYWGDLFDILTFIKTEEKRTLSVALQLFRGQHTTEYGLMFAASVIVIVPVIVIFIIFQKQFMQQGLVEGAVKG